MDSIRLGQINEVLNYDENVNGRLVINGETGDDSFYSDDNSAITTQMVRAAAVENITARWASWRRR